jgi:hypothetical protein
MRNQNYPTLESGSASLNSFHNNWLCGTPKGTVRLEAQNQGW